MYHKIIERKNIAYISKRNVCKWKDKEFLIDYYAMFIILIFFFSIKYNIILMKCNVLDTYMSYYRYTFV